MQSNQDTLYSEAVDLARKRGEVSILMLQRSLHLSYGKALYLRDTMLERGVIKKVFTGVDGMCTTYKFNDVYNGIASPACRVHSVGYPSG